MRPNFYTGPAIGTDLVSDTGTYAVYDVFGSAEIDGMKVSYSWEGHNHIVDDVYFQDDGYKILSVTGLDLEISLDELEESVWPVALNTDGDTFNGNSFSDLIRAGAGDDLVYGNGGNDVLYGEGGDDRLYGDAGDDDLYGGYGHDDLYGGAGSDDLLGDDGDDDLAGGIGRDFLQGGAGSDYLNGGDDADTLLGGMGKDFFVFDTAPKRKAFDVIQDFRPADDTVVLDNAVFTKVGKDGWLSGAAFRAGPAAKDASDRIIYNKATGALSYDADGNGGNSAVQIAKLKAGLSITKGDFFII
jgi:Ca2+-binding RTX toxin-like protein